MTKKEITKSAKDIIAKIHVEVRKIGGTEADSLMDDFSCMSDLSRDKIFEAGKASTQI